MKWHYSSRWQAGNEKSGLGHRGLWHKLQQVKQREEAKPKRMGWSIYALTAAYAALMLVSWWNCASYALENYQEERFNGLLQDKVVTVIDTPSALEQQAAVAKPQPVPEAPPIEVDFDALRTENPDIIAWIYCPDTEVSYPVLQSDDNQYYLRRRSDGSHHIAGSIFADYRNSADFTDENLILYGHNMTNGSMFALLPHYAQQNYYEEHPVWYLLTPTANYKVRLFAGFVTSTKSQVYSLIHEQVNGESIMLKAWEDSDFQCDFPPTDGEQTITLSTCSYEFSDARYVLIGTLQKLS